MPRHVALDVGQEHRDAGRRHLLGHELQRLGLAGAGRPGDQAVAVEHRQRHAHPRRRVGDAVDARPRRARAPGRPTAYACASSAGRRRHAVSSGVGVSGGGPYDGGGRRRVDLRRPARPSTSTCALPVTHTGGQRRPVRAAAGERHLPLVRRRAARQRHRHDGGVPLGPAPERDAQRAVDDRVRAHARRRRPGPLVVPAGSCTVSSRHAADQRAPRIAGAAGERQEQGEPVPAHGGDPVRSTPVGHVACPHEGPAGVDRLRDDGPRPGQRPAHRGRGPGDRQRPERPRGRRRRRDRRQRRAARADARRRARDARLLRAHRRGAGLDA